MVKYPCRNFEEELDLTEEEREYFEVPTETEDDFEEVYRHELREAIESEFAEGKYDDFEEEWSDDSNLSCSDCPPSECNGHCMSCSYRSF